MGTFLQQVSAAGQDVRCALPMHHPLSTRDKALFNSNMQVRNSDSVVIGKCAFNLLTALQASPGEQGCRRIVATSGCGSVCVCNFAMFRVVPCEGSKARTTFRQNHQKRRLRPGTKLGDCACMSPRPCHMSILTGCCFLMLLLPPPSSYSQQFCCFRSASLGCLYHADLTSFAPQPFRPSQGAARSRLVNTKWGG